MAALAKATSAVATTMVKRLEEAIIVAARTLDKLKGDLECIMATLRWYKFCL
jgi:hypothetical protein